MNIDHLLAAIGFSALPVTLLVLVTIDLVNTIRKTRD